jgi:hypothetical protein
MVRFSRQKIEGGLACEAHTRIHLKNHPIGNFGVA